MTGHRHRRTAGILGLLVFAGAYLLLRGATLWADGSGELMPFPLTGAYHATHREDRGRIAIIDFAGTYDRHLDTGEINVEARAVVAREFLRTHPDTYDFLVVFSTFAFQTGDAQALHWGVQNQVQGIGMAPYDVSQTFGSNGRLLGYIDMAALSNYIADPIEPAFEETLAILGHEVLHQWSGRVRFVDAQGQISDALLGKDGNHWSDLLDSQASVLYGHQWRDNHDGTFTSEAVKKFFSPLDLYLAGWYRPEEVPPLRLIDNPDHDAAVAPQPHLTVRGTPRWVTIDDIIAAEGPRIPAVEAAPKTFQFAFILLTSPESGVETSHLTALDQISEKFAERFAVWTGGRAIAQITPEVLPLETTGVPTAIAGGDPPSGAADLPTAWRDGLTWLRHQQRPNGSWQDKPTTQLRDTSVAHTILSQLDTAFTGQDLSRTWLAAQTPATTDYQARQTQTLGAAGVDTTDLRNRLLAQRNADGGWGIAPGFTSNAFDTSLVLAALGASSHLASDAIASGLQYLVARQNADGGWSSLHEGPSQIAVTTHVLTLLGRSETYQETQTAGLAWLVAQQHPDGGFGDGASTVHETAQVLQALIRLEATTRIHATAAVTYVLSRQQANGSWDGAIYTTALAVAALKRWHFPNWHVTPALTATPAEPVDGDRVTLHITVRNDGNSATPAGILRLFDGAPEHGGPQLGSDLHVPILAPGATGTVQALWDTFGAAGPHTLVAVIDPEQAQAEVSEHDNRAIGIVSVAAAPAGVDLSVASFTAIPAHPTVLPTTLGLTATVRNAGMANAEHVRVQLWEGPASQGTLVGESTYDVPSRSSIAVHFTAALTHPGSTVFTLVVDPEQAIHETSKANNSASTTVATQPSVDLQIRASDITVTPTPTLVGSDLTFTVTLHNTGTVLSPATTVHYAIVDGATTQPLAPHTLQIEPGGTAQRTLSWRADRAGDLLFTVHLDPQQAVPERDEHNNTASLPFQVDTVTDPNLTVGFQDLTFAPNPARQGQDLTLTAVVRNTGQTEARDIDVAFFDGDPAQGGIAIGARQTISHLSAATSATVSLVWPALADAADRLVFVSVDPDQTVAEASESDNTAFQALTVLSLPDLALADADIELTPGFPVHDEPVHLNIRIANLGEQGVSDATVRVFEEAPTTGRIQVGTDQQVAIAGSQSVVVPLTWTPRGADAISMIVVEVDPDHAILEQSKHNNIARKRFAVQEGDFVVSQHYFSPNADGIKDDTTFFFRFAQARDVEIVVVDASGAVVRHFPDTAFTQVRHGHVVWDGLDDLGRVVSDGPYHFQARHGEAQPVGAASVVVDNNRSPLVDAVGTPFAAFTNLTCALGTIRDLAFTDDEAALFLAAEDSDAYASGIYRTTNGTDLKALVTLPNNESVTHLHTAADGSIVAYLHQDATFQKYLFVVHGDGTNRRNIRLDDRPEDIHAVLTATNEIILTVTEPAGAWVQKVIAVPAFGGMPRLLYRASDRFETLTLYDLSPNQEQLLLGDGRLLYAIHVPTGAVQELYANDLNHAVVETAKWSPDGQKIAVQLFRTNPDDTSSYDMLIFDHQGRHLKTISPPLTGSYRKCIYLISGHLAWSFRSDAIAFNLFQRGVDECVTGDVFAGGLYIAELDTDRLQHVLRLDISLKNDYKLGHRDRLGWFQDGNTLFYGFLNHDIYAVHLDRDLRQTRLLGPDQPSAASHEPIMLAPAGRQLLYHNDDAFLNPNHACYQQSYTDIWSYSSRLNLTVQLQATRLPQGGGVLLHGTASDLHFDHYLLEYASLTTPDVWHPLQPASAQIVLDDALATWVPPQAGMYVVRLTASDLAGNRRQQTIDVAWMASASIADLYRTPALFSPNGDGTLDAVTLHYRVLAPVHLSFDFYDASGQRVRTIRRDHTDIGTVQPLVWDGRNDQGLMLPDGRYHVEVQNVALPITLDATPPEVDFALTGPYGAKATAVAAQSMPQVTVSPALAWAITEPHIDNAVIETATLDQPDNWQPFIELPPQQADGTPYESALSLQAVDNALFRLVAQDRAGNRTVVESSVAPQLIIDGFGTHEPNPGAQACTRHPIEACIQAQGGYYRPLEAVPYASLASDDVPNRPIVVMGDVVRFSIAETIAQQLKQVLVQYRALSESAWQEVQLTTFLDHALRPAADTQTPNLRLAALWELPALASQVPYVVRLKAIDASHQVHVSNALRFIIKNDLVLRGLIQQASTADRQHYALPLLASPGKTGLWGLYVGHEALRQVRLTLSSPDDPRYRVTQEVDVMTRRDKVLILEAPLAACKSYAGRLHATTLSGVAVQSLPQQWTMPCLNMVVKIEPEPEGDCNRPSAQQLHLHFAPASLSGSVLKLLTLSQIDTAGHEDVIFNVNQPQSVPLPAVEPSAPHLFVHNTAGQGQTKGDGFYPYSFTYPTATQDEGQVMLIATLIDIHDDIITMPIGLVIDHTPPTLALTYPLDGAHVCGIPTIGPDGRRRNMVTIEGEAADVNGLHYIVKAGPHSIYHSRTMALSADGLPILRQTPAAPFHLASITGAIAPLADAQGEVTVRVEVFDWGGFRQCTQRTFVVDAQADATSPSLDQGRFSPNGDGIADRLTMQYEVRESGRIDLHIFKAGMDPYGSKFITGDSLRHLETDKPLLSGHGLAIWDGRDDRGIVVPDGWYGLVFTFTDTCGNQRQYERFAAVDTTPPHATITYPIPAAPLTMLVDIQGSVLDPHLRNYRVQLGVGTAPDTWATLQVGDKPAQADILAQWNTFGLHGPHVLRLIAEDDVGNVSTVDVPLHLATRTHLIDALTVTPALFSPNRDGKREATTVRLGLAEAVFVNLTIQDEAGGVQRTLMANQTLHPGSIGRTWDGTNAAGSVVPEGRYTIVLDAALADNPAVRQEERVTVDVDTTPPEITISRPAKGVVSAMGEVQGSITDAHLSTYSVALAAPSSGSPPVVLRTGVSEVMEANLGSLQGLPEGQYTLLIKAQDAGEMLTQQALPVVIDNTPPVVALTAPDPSSIIGVKQSPLAIRGRITEDHLAYYHLTVGLGKMPDVWIDLHHSTSPPTSDILGFWDMAALPDGFYTLNLLAVDQADLRTKSQLHLTLDHTPPSVALAAPADGSYITSAAIIIGTVTDDHLATYQLDIAPTANPEHWSPLGSGAQEIKPQGTLHLWQGLPPDGTYQLRLQAVDQAGNTAHTVVPITVDTTPPAAPEGLHGTVAADRTIHLTWQASVSPDLAGYAVYRNGQRLTADLLTTTTYIDRQASDGHYTYTVRAIDEADWESQPALPTTLEVDFTPPQTRLLAPTPDTTVRGTVAIHGTAYSPEDFKAYRLYVGAGEVPTVWHLLRQSPVPVQADMLGQWHTAGLSHDVPYQIKLEAEDINGNIGSEQIRVTIDNQAPAVPTGLTAQVSGADVELSWSPNSESDLQGYLVYQNERLLHVSGLVVEDLRPLAIQATAYTHKNVADGTHTYAVAAIDGAGNISALSNAVPVHIDQRAPHAEFVYPEDGVPFDSILYVLATAADTDIAQMQFSYKAVDAAAWRDLGAPVTAAPYETTFDPVALNLAYGTYQLQVVATDLHHQVDPTPATMTVIYTDLTSPARVQGLAARVDGGEVHLQWRANTEDDLAGYHIERQLNDEAFVRLSAAPITETYDIDSDLADATYRYRLIAVDRQNNEAAPSEAVAAAVYTPWIDPPTTPTSADTVTLAGHGITAATVTGEVLQAGVQRVLAALATDDEGRFSVEKHPLAQGENRFTLRLTDAAGNISKPATVTVLAAAAPTQPTGLAATVQGTTIDLTWRPNPEADIAGYRLQRLPEPIPTNHPPPLITDTAYHDSATDGHYTYTLTAVNVYGFASPASVPVTIAVGDVIAPEPVILTATVMDTDVYLSWTPSSASDVQRYELDRNGVTLALPAVWNAHRYVDTDLVNGTYAYTVRAIDHVGNRSDASNRAEVTITDALPSAPTLHFPTTTGRFFATDKPNIDIMGTADPGVQVQLIANGSPIGTTQAQTTLEQTEVALPFATSPVLSPDGRYIAFVEVAPTTPDSEVYVEAETSFGTALRLYDSATEALIEVTSDEQIGDIRWASDSTRLIFSTFHPAHGTSYIRQYLLTDGTLQDLTDASETDINAAALSPDGTRLVVSGRVYGQEGLWLRPVDATDYAALTDTASVEQLDAASLQWSPCGTHIVYRRDDAYEIVDVVTGDLRRIDATASVYPPRWSPDCQTLLYALSHPPAQIRLYTLQTERQQDLVHGLAPQWSPDGKAVRYVHTDANAVISRHIETGAETTLLRGAALIPATLQTAAGGVVGLLQSHDAAAQIYRRLVPAGHFAFTQASLAPGDTVFTAIAIDASGVTSPASASMMITYQVEEQADLAVTADDIRVLPVAPKNGEPARVSVTVYNRGVLTAGATTLSLLAIDPAGTATVLLDDYPIAPLMGEAYTTVSASWTVGAVPGRYTLAAVVDPDNLIPENSKANNVVLKDLEATDAAHPAVAIYTSAPVYGAEQRVDITATLSNAGDPWTGRAEIRIEDAVGFPVDVLRQDDITSLVYGETLELSAAWPTDFTFAGAYQAMIRLLDQHGAVITQATARFRIAAASHLTSSLVSDQAVYTANQPVHLTGTLTYTTGNEVLSGIAARLQILNASAEVVAAKTTVLGDLLPGTQARVTLAWDTERAVAGTYALLLDVLDADHRLSQAHGQLRIAPSATLLSGHLSLSETTLTPGAVLNVTYTVTNEGNAPLHELPLVISLIHPPSGTVLQAHRTPTDIAVDGQVTATVALATSTLIPQRYSVRLHPELNASDDPDAQLSLAAQDVVVIDPAPPVIDIVRPDPQGFLNGTEPITFLAWDDVSPLTRVEFRIDGGQWLPAMVQHAAERLYGATLPQMAEGAHTLQARAVDASGHTGLSPVITFILDRTPPELTIEGVEADAIYRMAPYQYRVQATDAEGDTLRYTLLTAPPGMVIDANTGHISWTPQQPGAYAVTVQVEDVHGAASTQSFDVTVKSANLAPHVTSTPITVGRLQQSYRYQVEALDLNGDPLTYALKSAPAGMRLHATSGLITWIPTSSGEMSVIVRVTDPHGAYVDQHYTLKVLE